MSNNSAVCHVLVQYGGGECRSANTEEIRLFSKMRNERLRLPAFLRHYRRLGVDRFFIVDNGSTDGSTDYLLAQPDVHLFRTGARFREARGGTAWLNALLGEFGIGSWCVTVDVDELLWFPGSERTSLRTFTAYFDSYGYEALACLLLDLYPGGPLSACSYGPDQDPLVAAPYFDIGPYIRAKTRPGRSPDYVTFGGVRGRVFYPEVRSTSLSWKLRSALSRILRSRLSPIRNWTALQRFRPVVSPLLTKVPLVRWDRDSRYLGPHFVSHKVVAPETGVLLHFKFLQDFHEKAVQESTRGEYFGGASEYRRYCDKLQSDPNLSFMYEGSTKLESTEQLVALALMQDTEAWARHRAVANATQVGRGRRQGQAV